MTSSNEPSIFSEEKREWISLLNESVHTSDDIDIGDIYAVSRNFIVIKRGFVNVHYYYIPIKKVEGWDGNVLWLKITETEVKDSYERDTIPDPNQYYIKEYPYYTGFTGYNYPLPMISRRYLESNQDTKKSPPDQNVPKIYKCDLCDKTFNSDDELDKHMDIVAH
ncbi:MAG: C2H2-type zinc finger protein [Nitrososphaeraceae archaeon]